MKVTKKTIFEKRVREDDLDFNGEDDFIQDLDYTAEDDFIPVDDTEVVDVEDMDAVEVVLADPVVLTDVDGTEVLLEPGEVVHAYGELHRNKRKSIAEEGDQEEDPKEEEEEDPEKDDDKDKSGDKE